MRRALLWIAPLTAGLASALATGCNTDAYCFDCSSADVDGGATGGSSASSGTGGSISVGNGAGGGFFTDGGTCGDILTDPMNCGMCGLVCDIPNAFPKCEGGFCLVDTCALGWIDHNNQVTDGCEYQCTPSNSGDEICDGLDNDCNFATDELTDTMTDPFNCGMCNTVCAYSNAAASCAGGQCAMGQCFVGYHDVNQSDADGCEYACTVTNGGVEVCDAADNDCDTQVDEGFDLMTDAANCGSCSHNCSNLYPNSVGQCVAGVCSFGPCLPGYYDIDMLDANGCEYPCAPAAPGPEQCDGQDNDCNGLTDDGTLPGVGAPCGATNVGECELGVNACVIGVLTCQGEITPAPELCDALDNNCTGASDEGCPVVNASDARLDLGANSGVGQATSTQLSVAARADVILSTYLDRRSGNADIRANISTNGGTSWLATDLGVATGALVQAEPWATLSPTSAYVAFTQFPTAAHRDVYVARAAGPSYMTFSAPVRADKNATAADAFLVRAVVAKPGSPDTIVVVWESLSGSGSNVLTDVYLQRSLDNGVTWLATDLRINAVAGQAELPALATDGNGHAFIAWRDQRASKSEVYADVYDVTAGTLAGNKSISAGQASEGIAIAADDGGPNVYIAWTDLRTAKRAIRLNRSTNLGTTFQADGTVVNVDSTFADASAPALAARSGRVLVAWEDTRSGLPDIRVNHSEDAGATWLTTTSRADLGTTAGTSASTRPSIAFGNGNRVFVTWEDVRSGQRDIYANHSSDMGTTFQPLDLRMDVGMMGAPSPAGAADSRTPFMVTNAAAQRGLVVWVDYRTAAGANGAFGDIYANYFQ